jgi:hypothetical protein
MSRHLRLATRLARSGGCSVCSTHPSLRLSLKFLHFPLLLFSFYFSVQPWNIWNTYISNCSLRRNKGCRIPRRQAQTRAEAALLCNSEHARLQILIIAREGGGVVGRQATEPLLLLYPRTWLIHRVTHHSSLSLQTTNVTKVCLRTVWFLWLPESVIR